MKIKEVFIILFFILFINLGFVNAIESFEFNGTVYDIDRNPLNNTLINVSVINMTNFSVISYNFTYSNASGWFNLTINGPNNSLYKPEIIHFNSTNKYVDYIGKSLPLFPSDVFRHELRDMNFFLDEAATINLTAVNSSGQRVYFSYQIKDNKLGYPVSEGFQNNVIEKVISVPRGRNYSIMIFPNSSMPISFEWNNFSSSSSYSLDNNISSFNVSSKTLNKQFNTTMGYSRVYGYVSNSNISSWEEVKIIPFILESGGMIHRSHGALPYNLSVFFDALNPSDIYNSTPGYYNLSLPSTVENSEILIFASALNNSVYYGGFANISLNYNNYKMGHPYLLNFTLYPLLGSPSNLSMDVFGPGGSSEINISTSEKTFNLINSTNGSVQNVFAHVEAKLDYSSIGIREFTWVEDIEQSSSTSSFKIPLLNISGIKEMNIYAGGGTSDYTPKRISMTRDEVSTSSNLTLKQFNPNGIDSQINPSQIDIGLYISNSTCDVPYPPLNCIIGGNESNMSSFKPMSAILGGGKLSFRMGTGNIKVHYVNVDMLASGPPDALFDSSVGESSGNDFDAALRFGSSGPTIYDYVLISIPYSETAGSGLNDSGSVNLSIPNFYDDNWNLIWNSSVNGTNSSALGGNYSHYSLRQSEWQTLMSGVVCVTNVSLFNSTNPCYINTSNNVIWARLPHFSGTEPTIVGSVLASASSSPSTTTSTSSGGGSSSTETTTLYWASSYLHNSKEFSEIKEVNRKLKQKSRIKIKIDNEDHHVGVISMTESQAVINVSSSKSYQETFNVGDKKKFDVTDDNFYDIKVTLNSISNGMANVTIDSIHEKVQEEISVGNKTTQQSSNSINNTISEKKIKTNLKINDWMWIILIIIILTLISTGYYLWLKKKSKVNINKISEPIKKNNKK